MVGSRHSFSNFFGIISFEGSNSNNKIIVISIIIAKRNSVSNILVISSVKSGNANNNIIVISIIALSHIQVINSINSGNTNNKIIVINIIIARRRSFFNIVVINSNKSSNANNNIIVASRNSFFNIFVIISFKGGNNNNKIIVSSIVIGSRNSFPTYSSSILLSVQKLSPATSSQSIINSIIIPSVFVSSCKTNANIITITNTRNISKAGILSLSIYSNIIFFAFSKPFYGLHTSLSSFGLRQMMLFQSSIA